METLALPDLAATEALGQRIAASLAPRDVVLLYGDLGAGKTTLARAILQALNPSITEVPSPTFTLVQSYDTPKGAVHHFDLYRLKSETELEELGWDEARAEGIVLVEWPERLGQHIPAGAKIVRLTLMPSTGTRNALIEGLSMADVYKQDRHDVIANFLAHSRWHGATRVHMSGDSSIRSYDRLTLHGRTAVLMNAPLNEAYIICRPGMSEAERKSLGYFAMRRLAGARIDAFVCLAEYLREQGFSAPAVYEFDETAGLAIIEDFGDGQYWELLQQPNPAEREMYLAATDVLVRADALTVPEVLNYRGLSWPMFLLDYMAMDTEAELFLNWYLDKHRGIAVTDAMRADYRAAFHSMYQVFNTAPRGLIQRDYHSPNLMWLPERTGAQRVGLLDFQDSVTGHPAYNLMFLLYDARRDVPPALQAEIKERYYAGRGFGAAERANFDAAIDVYMALSNARLTSFPVRMKISNNLPQYMQFLPRIERYFFQAIQRPACAPLRAWFEKYLPQFLQEAA